MTTQITGAQEYLLKAEAQEEQNRKQTKYNIYITIFQFS